MEYEIEDRLRQMGEGDVLDYDDDDDDSPQRDRGKRERRSQNPGPRQDQALFIPEQDEGSG